MSAAVNVTALLRKIEQEKRRLANARAALMRADNWTDADEVLAAHEYVSYLDTESRTIPDSETRIAIPAWIVRHLLRSYHPTSKERG